MNDVLRMYTAVLAVVTVACLYATATLAQNSSNEDRQCAWYPKTCKSGVPTSRADEQCLDIAICDEFGKEYEDTNWPKSAEELELVCERYVMQHGFGQDLICGE